MFEYAFGSAIVGLAIAWAAAHLLPARLPRRILVLPTGAGGGLVGGLVSYAVMGPGNLGLAMVIAAAVSVAILSLLDGGSSRTPAAPATTPSAP
ncbi:hypothetical protein N566_25840 [Streptomycetaceae bacterium MP113-05]|nr:hypothetical protein N566_25840 [Streptomycetaceae bacterium MP113-05]